MNFLKCFSNTQATALTTIPIYACIKRLLVIIMLCGVGNTIAQTIHVSQKVADGPYVFYHYGKGYIKNITMRDSLCQVVIDSFPEAKKSRQVIKVNLNGQPDCDFTVKLHPLQDEPCIWPGNNKLLAVSDIEGEFAGFRQLLIANGVMDNAYNWTFDKGGLVICGDLFDRGQDVVPELWLLYKLEDEAKAKQGYVHVELGNHDIMNMSGDFRYVTPKYFAAAKAMGVPYQQLFDESSELGRWLHSKNIIEKIGSTLFVHGGISPQVNAAGLDIAAINRQCRFYYAAGWESAPGNLQNFLNVHAPFWYRGYFATPQDPKAAQSEVDSTLALFKVNQIVVGHTIIDHVSRLYSGKIYAIDVNTHEGHEEGLLIDSNKYYRVDDKGNKTELDN